MASESEDANAELLALHRIDETCKRLQQQGNFLEALECMERGLILRQSFFGRSSDEVWAACKTLGEMCNLLAMQYLQQGDFPMSLELLKKAEILTDRDDRGRAVTFNNLACYYRRQGKLRTSLQYLEKARKVEERMQIVENRADTYLNLCAVHSQLGHHTEALEHAQRALILLQEEIMPGPLSPSQGAAQGEPAQPSQDRIAVLAIAYHNIGVELEYKKEYEKAVDSYRKAVRIAEGSLENGSGITRMLQESLYAAENYRKTQQDKRGNTGKRGGGITSIKKRGASSSSKVKSPKQAQKEREHYDRIRQAYGEVAFDFRPKNAAPLDLSLQTDRQMTQQQVVTLQKQPSIPRLEGTKTPAPKSTTTTVEATRDEEEHVRSKTIPPLGKEDTKQEDENEVNEDESLEPLQNAADRLGPEGMKSLITPRNETALDILDDNQDKSKQDVEAGQEMEQNTDSYEEVNSPGFKEEKSDREEKDRESKEMAEEVEEVEETEDRNDELETDKYTSRSSSKNESPLKESAQKESARKESSRKESARKESARKESARNEEESEINITSGQESKLEDHPDDDAEEKVSVKDAEEDTAIEEKETTVGEETPMEEKDTSNEEDTPKEEKAEDEQKVIDAAEEKLPDTEEADEYASGNEKDVAAQQGTDNTDEEGEIPPTEIVLPSGWTKEFSRSKQKPYFFNLATGKSVWDYADVERYENEQSGEAESQSEESEDEDEEEEENHEIESGEQVDQTAEEPDDGASSDESKVESKTA